MKARIVTLAAAAALTLGIAAVPASASPAPANGRCVASGVKALRPAIPAAARGGLASFVILDHVFNDAEGVEAALGVDPCPDPT